MFNKISLGQKKKKIMKYKYLILLFSILLFIGCKKNNSFVKIDDISITQGKWYGISFWFDNYPEKIYNFQRNSTIFINTETSIFYQNKKEFSKYSFDFGVIKFESNKSKKGYEVYFRESDKTLKLRSIEELPVVKLYKKTPLQLNRGVRFLLDNYLFDFSKAALTES